MWLPDRCHRARELADVRVEHGVTRPSRMEDPVAADVDLDVVGTAPR